MKRLTSYLPDILMVGGAAALTTAAALMHPAAGFAVSGCFMLAAGILTAKASK